MSGRFVVLEYNQASGQPECADTEVHHERRYADEVADAYRASTQKASRRERYVVAELVIDEDPS